MSATPNKKDQQRFLKTKTSKGLVVLNIVLVFAYFILLAFFFPIGNKVLFTILMVGEVFHLWQLLTFLYTIWETKSIAPQDLSFRAPVDVYITIAGEPKEIIEETIVAAKAMDYPDLTIYLLNDGFVANRPNWQETEELGAKHGIAVITRQTPGGAKAGNINNAFKQTNRPFVVIFDADHVPHPDFLLKTMPYFSDPDMAFVQSPQYYKNYMVNEVTRGAWEQQELFFGPICRGKNRLNAVTMCGTNMVIRKEMIMAVGGMCEESIAEDFVTGLFLHEHGWKSAYVAEVLAEGLAPEDFLSYYKQQFRWARGALDVIFKYNLLFRKNLTLAQKIQYLASASFYLSGGIIVLHALIPIIFFFSGLVPVVIATMLLALIFLPYIFVTLYTLQGSSNFTYTFRSLAFSMSSFSIHLEALWSILTGSKPKFEITSKKKLTGNFLYLVKWHIGYVALVLIGLGFALYREGLSASIMANMAWTVLNAVIFAQFIALALPQREVDTASEKEVEVPAL
ncbi:MAG: glycosyltransferase [Patescibacteria group bacterium]